MKKLFFSLLFISLTLPCYALDKVTSYTDANGNTVYTNEKTNVVPQNARPNTPVPPFDRSKVIKKYEYQQPYPINKQNNLINQNTQPSLSSSQSIDKALFGLAKFTSIIGILIFFSVVMWLFALVDILRNEFEGSNKLIWVIVTTLFPMLGSILYFFIGLDQKIDKYDDPVT